MASFEIPTYVNQALVSTVSGIVLNSGDQLLVDVLVTSKYGTVTGTAISSTVNSGGFLDIEGANATGITLNGGSALDNAGTVTGPIIVNSGGNFQVGTSATVTGVVISSGGREFIFTSGFDNSATISGTQTVYGVATGGTVFGGGTQKVFGSALNTTVSSGGQVVVQPGGRISGAIVQSGGTTVVSASGNASATTISGGGSESLAGRSFNTNVLSGGTEIVSSGGIASATTLGAGGILRVSSGGVVRAASAGVYANTSAVTIVNSGVISTTHIGGTAVTGVVVGSGGTIVNGSTTALTATVAGYSYGVALQPAATLSNFGTVKTTGAVGVGIVLSAGSAGGVIVNGQSGSTAGVVSATSVGIQFSVGATVTNPGTVTIANFGTITGTAGIVIGDATATVTNPGTVTISNYGTIIGTGSAGTGGTAIRLGTVSGTSSSIHHGTIGFDLIVIGSRSASLQGVVANLRPGDAFDLPFMPFDTAGIAPVVTATNAGTMTTTLSVVENGTTFTIALDPNQNFSGAFFQLGTDAGGLGTLVTEKIGIIDIVPSNHDAETSQDSEPSLAVNPLNPNQIIAGSFGAGNGTPYLFTTDGGVTWADFGNLTTSDKSLAWLADGTGFINATLNNAGQIVTYLGNVSTPGFGAAINTTVTSNLDQPWVRTGSSNHVYISYNDGNVAGGSAAVNVSNDGGTTFSAVVIERVGGILRDDPAVRLAVNGNTVYAAFTRWNSQLDINAGDTRFNAQVVVVRSDNGGTDQFMALGTGGVGAVVASPTASESPANVGNTPLSLGQERTESELAIAVDPSHANHLLVSYIDAPGTAGSGNLQLHISESTDSGATWTARYTTAAGIRAAQPALAILANGAIGFLYDSYVPGGANPNANGTLVQHFVTTSDDFATTQDTVLASETNNAPAAAFQPYLGDFFDLTSVGNIFYGMFGASNNDIGDGTTGAAFTNVDFRRDFMGTLGTPSFQLVSATPSIDPFLFQATALPSTAVVPCFCRGTLILTDAGEVSVENLVVGDRVKTLSGAVKPIVWIGCGRDLVTKTNRLARPVIVRRGALADNVPHRDLYLTHGHALYLNHVLIPVENLVNYHSIVWDESARVVEYYHIELADHDVLVANGAPAESYYDANNRAQFHNIRAGSAAGAAQPSFAPVLNGGDLVEQVWMELFERAGGQIERETTDDPELHALVASERLAPLVDGCTYEFAFPGPPPDGLILRSRSGVPSLLGITRHDHRVLGVAISRIEFRGPGAVSSFDPDAWLFRDGGCHFAEDGYAWTGGEFELPARLFAHLSGPFSVIVHTEQPGMRYPLDPPLAKAA